MVFLGGLTLLLGMAAILKIVGRSYKLTIPALILGAYLLMVAGVTLFPIPMPVSVRSIDFREQIPFVLSKINFIPFRYVGWFNFRTLAFEMILNVILTIPFGFLVNFLFKVNWKKVLWLSLASGLLIESAQLMLSLVFGAYRTVDISDVLLNGVGSLIGFMLYKIPACIIGKLRRV